MRTLIHSFVLALVSALPDALLALWLMLLGKGVLDRSATLVGIAAIGLGLSATATWFLRTVSTRVAIDQSFGGGRHRHLTETRTERWDRLDEDIGN